MSRLNLRKWTFDGERLAHPLTMARRLVAFPFMKLAKGLLWASVALGWGLFAAHETVRDV